MTDLDALRRFDTKVNHSAENLIEDAIAEIEALRKTLMEISKRDGRASDHIACYDCADSSEEALAALGKAS